MRGRYATFRRGAVIIHAISYSHYVFLIQKYSINSLHFIDTAQILY